MRHLPLFIAAAAALWLQGCASHPETRAFTEQERYQLSMESLNRQGLPYDDYMREKAQLLRAQSEQAGRWVQLPPPARAREG
ncbi:MULTISPECIES: hypothetical protein [unclassified Pseudomonas]|uniref:hypothetical protein n=1 Tax=unclassified Pseudomonas TaxID=196821 RepID=UPI000BE43D32|nr:MULTISPECIES: hypothetical protein [unclassified Pseudomonas]